MTITGRQLKEHRQQLGLSQAKLAEITGVSQHLLSAFERESAALNTNLIGEIVSVLADTEKVTQLAKRAKRVRQHEYAAVPRLPERIARSSRTEGNRAYLEELKLLGARHTAGGKRQHTALSLFSGCGGFSLGFSAAGYELKGFLELEEELRNIYRLNFPDSVELGSDIGLVDDDRLQAYAKQLSPIDVIIGGPPCQGFSLSGKRNVADPRNMLFKQYLRFVDAFKPRVAVLENVRLLCSMKNERGTLVIDDIYSDFKKHHYKIMHFEVNAKDYGIPQHRERVLFIAVREDVQFAPSIPERISQAAGNSDDFFSSMLPARTFGDACSDLPYIESGEHSQFEHHSAVKHPNHVIEWLWDVPQGVSAHDNLDEAKRPPSGYNTTYKRQVWNEPASTVQTTFGMISGCRNVHPIATRSLTVREAARIQSFPDTYKLTGTLGAIRTGLGNAVPPLLAYHVANHLKTAL